VRHLGAGVIGPATPLPAIAAIAFALSAFTASAATVPAQLPAPDGKPGDPAKPVKVYMTSRSLSASATKKTYSSSSYTTDVSSRAAPLNNAAQYWTLAVDAVVVLPSWLSILTSLRLQVSIFVRVRFHLPSRHSSQPPLFKVTWNV
jgi:hypothetical protein